MHLTKLLKTTLVCALLSAPSLIGQNLPDALLRTVNVNVVGEGGVFLRNLNKENFIVTYRGKPANVLNLAYTDGPRRVAILLDMSGSMSGQQTGKSDKWQIARAAAWELIASLPRGSKAALITFTDKAQTRAALSPDFAPIQDWLNSEAASHPETLKGHTAVYGAILAAVKAMEPTEPGDAIYVITDAGENASQIRASEVEKALGINRIRLFAFILSDGPLTTPEEQEGWAKITDMSRNSGGFITGLDAKNIFQYESPRSWRYVYDDQAKSQIRFSAQKFSLQIASFYALTFQIPESPTKPQRWELEVVDESGHKRKDVTLAYPREIFPGIT